MTTDTFAVLPLASIAPSLTNPRKSFNPAKLAELAESIKASGVHQPILVRPLPGSRLADTFDIHTASGGLRARPEYEIVAGERRYRASKSAGLEVIPAMIRAMADDQVLEAQIVENLQRDDLTELEEAEGYEALMAASQITAEAVGSKIGKSRSYVYGRLKLLDMSHECKQAMRDGDIDASRALLIARIPDTALQTKALQEATRKDYRGEVCSVRAFQSWLHANVMLHLDKAKFSPSDAYLVVGVGSCKDCPKRTGANPDLFTDVTNADICTDPICFREKEEAHRCGVLDTAQKRGMRLIDGDEAKDICHQYHNQIQGYSPLSQERNDTADGQTTSLGKLLGKDAPAPVLIENPWTKELIAAVPTDEAEAMLLARGLVKAVLAKAKKKDDIEADIKRLQDRANRAIDSSFRETAFEALAAKVHNTPPVRSEFLVTPALMRAWFMRNIEELEAEYMADLFGITLEPAPGGRYSQEVADKDETTLRLHIQACDGAKLWQAMALHLVEHDKHGGYYNGTTPPTTLYDVLAKDVEVDLDAIRADVTATVRAETAAELKKLKAALKSSPAEDPENLPTIHAPAAQALGGGLQGPKGKGVKAPAAPAGDAPRAKRKLSAADAQAAIAAAMQGQDTDSGADAQGNGVDSSQPVASVGADAPKPSLAVDTRVVVTSDTDRLPITQHKFAGKVGTITQQMEDDRFMVTFQGRIGGMCAFDHADLQPAPANLVADKPVPVAYRGRNGETWSGRGLKPRWLVCALEAGHTMESLKVQEVAA